MPSLINKCTKCGRYTLRSDKCPVCGGAVRSAHPPAISLKHRYLDLIIQVKRREGGKELKST